MNDNIFCLKCKTKTECKDRKEVFLKNNKRATAAVCVVCESRVSRIEKQKVA